MSLVATIDVSQFIRNIQTIRKRTRTNIIAVVKADAYGHGAAALSQYGQNYVEEFAVADIREALELQRSGIVKPINILSPVESLESFKDLTNIVPTLCSLRDINTLKRQKNKPLRVNVEINTGMNRLGIAYNEVPCMQERLHAAGLQLKSVFSHLYNAADYEAAKKQRAIFESATQQLPKEVKRHIAASACMHLPENFFLDAVRPGIGLYGYALDTQPIVTIHASILKIFNVAKGETISYGSYIAPRNMLVAAVRAGYADGIRRKSDPEAENRFMQVGDVLCPIVGQVCMDITMIDVTQARVNYAQPVYVLSSRLRAEALADAELTNVYEVLTSFKGRVERRYTQLPS